MPATFERRVFRGTGREDMKLNRGILALGTPIFVLALTLAAAAPAFATPAMAGEQEKPVMTSKDKEQTVKVTVTGETELDYVWRRQEVTAFTGGVSGTNTPGNSSSE